MISIKASKLLIPVLALGMFAATPFVRAQDESAPSAEKGERKGPKGEKGQRGGMNPEAFIARIDQALGGLTDEQKTKIKDIIAKTREQMQALPQEERREKGRELMRAQGGSIRAVLTDEQKAKFDEMPQGRGAGGEGGERKRKKDQ